MSRTRRRNIGQIQRSNTLAIIREWIEEAKKAYPNEEIDRSSLKRKICLVIGATPKRAEDYLDTLGIE